MPGANDREDFFKLAVKKAKSYNNAFTFQAIKAKMATYNKQMRKFR